MENINLRKRIQEINTLLNPTFTNTLSADGSTIIIEEWMHAWIARREIRAAGINEIEINIIVRVYAYRQEK